MPDDQFIFSSSWLPSPRFELWTLAGYTTWQKPEILHKQKLGCVHSLTWSQEQLFYMCQVNVDLGSAHDTYSVKNVEDVWA